MTPNVPPRFADASVKTWREQTHDDIVADVLDGYIESAARHFDSGRGLLLLGPPGVGKTYLICAVINALGKSYDVRFVTLYNYLRGGLRRMELKEQWLHQGDDEAYTLWKRMTREMDALRHEYDFVAMDDIGMEHHSDTKWSEDEFQVFVRIRFDQALPTLLTSNLMLDEWGKTYGQPMRSFVNEAFIHVSVAGDDLRWINNEVR